MPGQYLQVCASRPATVMQHTMIKMLLDWTYTSTAWAQGDGTQQASGSGNTITLTPPVTCTKIAGCSLDVRRYFYFQGMAHELLGGSGDYYYGEVRSDISVSLVLIPQCDSTSYTSCASRYYFASSGSKTNVCGDSQYYYTSAFSPTLVTWTVSPSAAVDYDIYTRTGSCASTATYDQRTFGGVGVQESLSTCSSSGSNHVLASKYSGSGTYDISLTSSNVECCSNDWYTGDANTNNDRSSQCSPAEPRCDTRVGSATQYTCVVPEPCNTNADCIPGECCTADSTLPISFKITPGKCVDLGNKRTDTQPTYLCTN